MQGSSGVYEKEYRRKDGTVFPEPVRKIIGDLSNTERVLVGLDLIPVTKTSA